MPLKKTIMVIEDDLAQLQLAEDNLTEAGFTVLPCKSGIMAMDCLEHSPVDLIVSDIRMPDLDMTHLLGYLAIHYSHIPVIITTAYPEYATLPRKSGNTVKAYFQKPVDYDRLLESIREHLPDIPSTPQGTAPTAGSSEI